VEIVVQRPFRAGRPLGTGLLGRDRTRTTNAAGVAELCSPGPSVRVVVSRLCIAVERPLPADAARLEIELGELAPAASTVVVTGAPEPRTLAETDRSLTVLKVEDRDTVSWSFADLIKQDSSVHVRERGPDGDPGGSVHPRLGL
jgi:hypothetical protein